MTTLIPQQQQQQQQHRAAAQRHQEQRVSEKQEQQDHHSKIKTLLGSLYCQRLYYWSLRQQRQQQQRRQQGRQRPRRRGWLRRVVVIANLLLILVVASALFWFRNSSSRRTDFTPNKTLLLFLTNNNDKNSQQQQQQQQPKRNNNNNNIHLVFSTGCSAQQHWQSYVFFYHAMQVQQPGHVTRIASCPSEIQRDEVTRRHDVEIAKVMSSSSSSSSSSSNRFHIHTTPDYSYKMVPPPPGFSFYTYYYFNKPFGLKHWMEHVLGYPHPTNPDTDDMIIAVLDADMILLQPIVNDFSSWSPPSSLWNKARDDPRHYQPRTRVEHGYPMAQEYYWNEWQDFIGIEKIASIVGADSPAVLKHKNDINRSNNEEVEDKEEKQELDDFKYSYGAGPPYLLTARDMYRMVLEWCRLAPQVYRVYPKLLAEMFSYSIAAANLELKHQIANGFMVSNIRQNAEGWQGIDAMPLADACRHDRRRHDTNNNNNNYSFPLVLHYCQDYSIGKYWFYKAGVNQDMLSCDAPLLMEPPVDAGERYNYFVHKNGGREEFPNETSMTSTTAATSSDETTTTANSKRRVRSAFMTCTMFYSLNQAAIHFKDHHCKTATTSTADYNKTMRVEAVE